MSLTVGLRNITVRLPGVHGKGLVSLLNDVSFEAPASRVTAIVGPSGSGKTTMLRVVAGLIRPTTGQVLLGEKDISRVPASERDVAMAFQSFALYPGHTVRYNLEVPLAARGVPRKQRRKDVDEMLGRLGLDRRAGYRIEALSGGEQQRVALGRALIRRPRVLLLDEPMSSVDPAQRRALVTLLRELLAKEPKPTTLLVTHDWAETSALAEHVVMIEGGRLLQQGSVREILYQPQSLAVLDLSASPFANRVGGLERTSGSACLLQTEGGLSVESSAPLDGDRFTCAFEPDALQTSEHGFPARVCSHRPVNHVEVLEVEISGQRLFAVAEGSESIGTTVRLAFHGPGQVADASGQVVARIQRLWSEPT